MSLIKICGLRSAGMAIRAAASGADLLGFILAPSKRQVTSEAVGAMLREVRAAGYATPAVAVCVDPDPAQLAEVVATSGVDYVQLSGDEQSGAYTHIDIPIIKAIPAGLAHTADDLRRTIDAWALADYYLLDAHDPTARGGTGKRANWELAAAIAADVPILLAGGLAPENVAEAIDAVRPAGVDVSSGVETAGVKDGEKIDAFIRHARAAYALRSTANSRTGGEFRQRHTDSPQTQRV